MSGKRWPTPLAVRVGVYSAVWCRWHRQPLFAVFGSGVSHGFRLLGPGTLERPPKVAALLRCLERPLPRAPDLRPQYGGVIPQPGRRRRTCAIPMPASTITQHHNQFPSNAGTGITEDPVGLFVTIGTLAHEEPDGQLCPIGGFVQFMMMVLAELKNVQPDGTLSPVGLPGSGANGVAALKMLLASAGSGATVVTVNFTVSGEP